MVDSLTTRWPGPIAGAYSQILTPQPLCFTVGLRCYADMHWFFSPNMVLYIMIKCHHFGVICPKDIVPVFWFLLMHLSKPNLCLSFARSGFREAFLGYLI